MHCDSSMWVPSSAGLSALPSTFLTVFGELVFPQCSFSHFLLSEILCPISSLRRCFSLHWRNQNPLDQNSSSLPWSSIPKTWFLFLSVGYIQEKRCLSSSFWTISPSRLWFFSPSTFLGTHLPSHICSLHPLSLLYLLIDIKYSNSLSS